MFKKRSDVSFYKFWQPLVVLGCLLVAALVVAACNSGTVSTASGMGTVSVMLSDPATCQAPAGPYSHVYVTITDVQANVSSTASATDSGWVDLTPNLPKNPQQIDLLGLASNQCFLATLGDSLQLQAGSYQQIRVILASNSATLPSSISNACKTAGSANCVVLASDSSVHTLQLSSEAQTGIKIPSGQIASGAFTIGAGQTKDLDIDFNTCESIVQEGNGQYRLMPVLHAGEVSTTSTSINGKVLDHATGNPVAGTVTVAVEQKDTTGVDRIVRSMTANADGSFVFCPLPAGTYDVVIVGTRSSDGAIYQPSIVTGVSVGSTTGNVSLYPPTTVASGSVSLNGTVTSQNSSNAGTVADIQLSTLETISSNTYTIPLPPTTSQSVDTLSVETGPTSGSLTCPVGTDCANYTLVTSSGGVYIGAWASSGVTLSANATWASYVVDAVAYVPGSGATRNCSVATPQEVKSATLTITPAGPFTPTLFPVTPALAFTQCQ